jgi:hypothetical protein
MNSREKQSLLDDVFLQPWFLPLKAAYCSLAQLVREAMKVSLPSYLHDDPGGWRTLSPRV